MNLFDNNGALFSDCGKHRLSLWRIWDDTKPLVMFIGLNPSTANASEPDPTITRVVGFAKTWGSGGVYMMNLFTFISTDPSLLNVREGNLPGADDYLFQIGNKCEKVVFAWGAFKVHGRDNELKAMFPTRFALKVNKNGSPIHPLYVKGDTQLIKY